VEKGGGGQGKIRSEDVRLERAKMEPVLIGWEGGRARGAPSQKRKKIKEVIDLLRGVGRRAKENLPRKLKGSRGLRGSRIGRKKNRLLVSS